MQIWIVFYSTLFALGSVLTYFAWMQYKESQKLLNKGEHSTAKVIAYETSSSKKGKHYASIFEFKDHTQNLITFTSSINSSPPTHDIGEMVTIVYNKNNPYDVKVISFWGLYRWSVILLMLASPLLVIGGSYLLYSFG